MSSILDALRKLERDQAMARAEPDPELTRDVAEEELVGDSVLHTRIHLRLTPMNLVLFGITIVGSVAVVSTIVTLVLLSARDERATPSAVTAGVIPSEPPAVTPEPASAFEKPASEPVDPAATAPPVEEPKSTQPPDEVESISPTPEAITTADAISEPESPAAIKIEEPKVQTPEPVAAIPPAALNPVGTHDTPPMPLSARPPPASLSSLPPSPPLPELFSQTAPPRPATERPAPSRTSTASRPSPTVLQQQPAARELPDSITDLPRLTPSLQRELGLENFKVNMLRPVGPRNPKGVALINGEQVLEGERIYGAGAILLKVETSGIAIEMTGTGDRYFVKFL